MASRYLSVMDGINKSRVSVGVVFDFDGTLADTVDLLVEASRAVLRSAGYEEAASADLEALRDMHPRRALEAVGIPLRAVPGLVRRLRRELRRRSTEVELVDEAPAFIESLHGSGFTLGIMSSNSPTLIRSVIERSEVARFFKFVARGGTIRDRARRLSRVVRRYSGLAEQWIFVGDEIRDLEAASRCGIPFVAVNWGVANPEALATAGARQIVTSWSELGDVLESMSKDLQHNGLE
jgi:phosphoglycolate phosphatase